MTRPDEPQEHPALSALVEHARNNVEPPTAAQLNEGLMAVRARLDARPVRRQRLRWVAAAAVLVMLPLALFLFGPWRQEPPAISYQVEGGNVLEGGYLQAPRGARMSILFNEGTQVVLDAGARGRLRSVNNAAVELGIAQGSASFRVTPNQGRRWTVEVGPFLVTVKGTMFSVSWDPSSERFELQLRHGSVAVSGPVAGGDLTLKAGQRLVVDLAKADTSITEDWGKDLLDRTPDPAVAEAVSAAPSASPGDGAVPVGGGEAERSARAPSSSKTGAPAPESGRDWSRELAHGRWDQILEDVERAGVEATLSGASSEELAAVADAARYRRRNALARQALTAQRSRFPASRRALDAAFLLGRVEEAEGGQMTRALAWYDEYLTQAPTGSYAGEALIRKMTIVNKIQGATQARPIAQEYLRRFPKGRYAGSARALLGER
jgi:ferric-dicitrate binding protein FerR (iron transport regulator)/TolA-binding protein